ncbi:MAG: triose-phosphate isomerase [Parcubacteria group bacterium]
MSKPIIVANWKNYPSSVIEAKSILRDLGKNRLLYKKISLFIAPPLVYLEQVAEKSSGFAKIAVQDLFQYTKGSFTGSVTPDILRSFGARLSIIGHSERRALGETSDDVASKVKIALKEGLTPLVCIGENYHDQDGEHFGFLREQLETSLKGIHKSDSTKIVIAYEPVWAIGKSGKDAMKPEDLAQAVIFIRKVLSDMFGNAIALKVPILYGGSVDPSNVESLWKETSVSGFLVGRASLKALEFKKIVESTL